jgi:hypothetical protein
MSSSIPSGLYLRWTNKALDEYMGASSNLRQLCAGSESRLTQAEIGDGQNLKHALLITPIMRCSGRH